jgi:predicted nucleotidyltransferase
MFISFAPSKAFIFVPIVKGEKAMPQPVKNRQEEVLNILQRHKPSISKRFGVLEIGIFGSVARGEAQETSDIDVVVKTEVPDLFMMVDLKEELENLLGADVDLVRYWPRMNPYLKRRIDREARYA